MCMTKECTIDENNQYIYIYIYILKKEKKKKKKSILNINPIKAGVGLNLIPKKKNKQTNKHLDLTTLKVNNNA